MTTFESLFPKYKVADDGKVSGYYAGRSVANSTPVYPDESLRFVAYNERNRTVGRSEHALRISELQGITLDANGLPKLAKGKTWRDHVKRVLVERFTPENRQNATGINTPLPVPVHARILLMASESLLGFDNSMARVSARIVLDTLASQQTSRWDKIFHSAANAVLAIEYDKTKSTEHDFVLFCTIDGLLAQVVKVRETARWLDANMGGSVKKITKKSKAVVELDDESDGW